MQLICDCEVRLGDSAVKNPENRDREGDTHTLHLQHCRSSALSSEEQENRANICLQHTETHAKCTHSHTEQKGKEQKNSVIIHNESKSREKMSKKRMFVCDFFYSTITSSSYIQILPQYCIDQSTSRITTVSSSEMCHIMGFKYNILC